MSEKYLLCKNVRMRAFVLEKREVLEVYATVGDKEYIQYHGEFDLGESAVDFLYGDFRGIFRLLSDQQTPMEKLLGHTENMPLQHPYFGIASQAAHRLQDSFSEQVKVDTLSDLVPLYRAVQEDIQVLVSECLNVELRQESTVPELYAALLRQGKFPMEELTWKTAKAEIVPVEAVPPRKRGLMPEVLMTEELHERGIKTALVEVLYPETITDLYCYLKSLYLRHEVRFKPCKHCGRYFVVTGNNATEYCNRPILGSTKTCRQIGAVRIYQSRQMENPAIKAFTKAYKTHNARVRYGTLTHEQFTAWSKTARAKRDECVSGKLSLEDFQEWLDNH